MKTQEHEIKNNELDTSIKLAEQSIANNDLSKDNSEIDMDEVVEVIESQNRAIEKLTEEVRMQKKILKNMSR